MCSIEIPRCLRQGHVVHELDWQKHYVATIITLRGLTKNITQQHLEAQ